MKIRDLSREKPFTFAALLSACIFLIAILASALMLYLVTRDTDSFGVSLALDDDTMVLSIHSDQKAYVLQREGNGWVLQSEISPKEPAYKGRLSEDWLTGAWGNADRAIALDGDAMVVLADSDQYRELLMTAFRYSDGIWQLEQEINVHDLGYDSWQLGDSLDINLQHPLIDNDSLLVSDEGGAGDLYFFQYSGSEWNPEYKHAGAGVLSTYDLNDDTLFISGKVLTQTYDFVSLNDGRWVLEERFGASRPLAGIDPTQFLTRRAMLDGDTLVLLCEDYNKDRGSKEVIYILRRHGDAWELERTISADEPLEGLDLEGIPQYEKNSVLSGDTLVLGANYYDDPSSFYILRRDGGGDWSLEQEISVNNSLEGLSREDFVSMHDSLALDGDTLAITGAGRNIGSETIYVFERQGSSWSLAHRLRPAEMPRQ